MSQSPSNLNSLTIERIDCVRGEKALFSGLNSQLNAKQCLHVVGPNGSGKTSLLRIIAGLAQPETGQILWNNKSIARNTNFLKDSAFIGHKDALKNELSAIENLRFYQHLETQKNNTNTNENQLDDCLNKLEILHCADLLTQHLSFGQRRRLSFAKLLLKPYKLWILDEPFTGIDASGRQLIEYLCVEHLNNNGLIILTHHQSLCQSTLNGYVQELNLEPNPASQSEPQTERLD